MTLDERLRRAALGVADRVEPPYVDIGAVRDGARARTRRTQAAVVGAVVLVMAVTGLAIQATRDPRGVDPVVPPKVASGSPVWYDAAGLHHGDLVVQTAVELLAPGNEVTAGGGVLTLVRTGALYRDPASDDVWFHPWGGQPRIVGSQSTNGPAGDVQGDLAAWFEGDELVVYDTVRDSEVLRSTQEPVVNWSAHEHLSGNGFQHVSVDEVVWRSEAGVHRLDMASGDVEVLWVDPSDGSELSQPLEDRARAPRDVHDDIALWGGAQMLETVSAGRAGVPLETLEPEGRLSSDGAFVLAGWTDDDGGHGAAIADVVQGEVWKVPHRGSYAWFAWSYGDVAVVRTGGQLLACHAVTRSCDPLPRAGGGRVLLPS